ncbi:uncharacterized protein [Acropora muricata]|uniref:uncharacterized protein n=1 Tax=Acropora muricata TaxID=159855 RepID=UPI0034E505AE
MEEGNRDNRNGMAAREEGNEQFHDIDIDQPLAEFQVALNDIERASQNQGTISRSTSSEDEMDDLNEQFDRLQERNRQPRIRRDYLQRAADISGPLAELQVPGTNIGDNDTINTANGGAVASEDGRVGNESGSRGDAITTKKKKRCRKHYMDVAEQISGSLAGLHIPGTSDDRSFDEQSRHHFRVDEAVGYDPGTGSSLRRESFGYETSCRSEEPRLAQQESISEYNPNGSCFDSYSRSVLQHEELLATERDLTNGGSITKSASEQLSDCSPNVACGSGFEYEISRDSTSQIEARNDGEQRMQQGSRELACQESVSQHGVNDPCVSVSEFYRGKFDVFTDYSLPQTQDEVLESAHSTTCPIEGATGVAKCHKDERNIQPDSCQYQRDEEPSSKKSKLSEEMKSEKQWPFHNGRSDAQTSLPHSLNSEMLSIQATHLEFVAREEIHEFDLQNNWQHSRERNNDSLSSEFEQLNLEDNTSVETGIASDYSIGWRSDWNEGTQALPGGFEDGVSGCSGRLDSANCDNISRQNPGPYDLYSSTDAQGSVTVENSSGSGNSLASVESNACHKVLQDKSKVVKTNTKSAYRELAQNISGDLRAMNLQLDRTKDTKDRTEREQRPVNNLELCCGSTLPAGDTNDSLPFPLETDQGNEQEERRVTDPGRAGRSNNAVCDEMRVTPTTCDSSSANSNQRVASLKNETPEAAELRRTQIEEQQKSTDNMGPELQALVIEMMQRDANELGGGHVLYCGNSNPPVPRRLQSHRQGEDRRQGAAAHGSSQQSTGKKSGKKKKKTRHYKELAGLMAPELAALNATLTNGHGRGSGQLHGDEGTTIPYVAHQGAAGGSNNNDVREISRAESPANQRQQRGNRRSADGGRDSTRRPGKENKLPSQRHETKDDVTRSRSSQMAENTASSLQRFNSQLDEQQKQRALIHGAASPTPDEMGDGLVARNSSSERDGSSSSQGSPHNPLK